MPARKLMTHRQPTNPDPGSSPARLAGGLLAAALLALILGCGSSGNYAGAGTLGGGDMLPDDEPRANRGGPDGGTPPANTATDNAPAAGNPPTATNSASGTASAALTADQERRARGLVSFLVPTNPDDAQQSEAARQSEVALVEMGGGVIPLLESMVTPENALRITAVIVRIRRNGGERPVPPPIVPFDPPGDLVGNTPGNMPDPTPPVAPDNAPDNAGATPTSNVPDPEAVATSEAFLRNLMGLNVPAGSEGGSAAIGRFIWRRLKDMEDLARKLDYAGAIRIGEAVLTLLPGTQYARQIRARIEEFELRRLQLTLLDGRIAALQPEVMWGKQISFRITLRNVSQKRITIMLSNTEYRSRMQQDTYTSPVVLRVKFTQWADPSTPVSNTRTEYLEAGGEVVLDPGQVWSMDWTLDSAADGREQVRSIGEYEVSAQIRPLEVRSVDGQESIRMIECKAARARVLPAGYEQARANPMVSLRQAFHSRDPIAAVLAAGAAREQGGEPRRDVVGWLIDQLPSQPLRTRQLAFQCLRAATGLQLGMEDYYWTTWYAANKDKPDLGLGPGVGIGGSR